MKTVSWTSRPRATAEPGLRQWLHELPDRSGARAATFDIRLDKSPWLTGVASRGIAKPRSSPRLSARSSHAESGIRQQPVGSGIWIALAWMVGILLVAYIFAMTIYHRAS
jgi:hypothetical protein